MLTETIIPYLRQHLDRYLSDLRTLVAIDSGTQQKAGVDAVQAWMEARLRRLGFGIEDAGGQPAQVKLRDRQVEPLDRVLPRVRQGQGGELADLPQNQQLFGIGYGVPLALDAFGEKAQHLEIDQKLAAFDQPPRFL